MEAFQLLHHSTMLGDEHRLTQFRAAINQCLSPGDVCVDIGTGTGILASYAAEITHNHVFAVEYFAAEAEVASLMLKDYPQVKVIRDASYHVSLKDFSPDCLISETIGPVGPEENIVEIFYEFVRRHPSLRCLIPYRLDLKAIPVRSAIVSQDQDDRLQAILQSSHGRFQYSKLHPALERIDSKQIRQGILSDGEIHGPALTLISYELGKTARSDFQSKIFLPDGDWNAVHLYFEAHLAEGIKLSSFILDPLTHWRHTYLTRPRQSIELSVHYSSKTKNFEIIWGD